MANNSTVGSSDGRTPLKHFILDKALGRIVGVTALGKSTVPARMPLLVVDMCAGDGVARESGTSSPEIIAKHIEFKKLNGKAKAIFYEAAPASFNTLRSRFESNLRVELRNADSSGFDLKSELSVPDQAVFIHADPNSIETYPITRELCLSMSPTTTLLVTLGCNVNGLKRLPWESRKPWAWHVKNLVDTLSFNHDLIIFTLERDQAQWSYVLRLPHKWSNETEQMICKACMDMWPKGINSASYKHRRSEFSSLVQKLFLTKSEIDEGKTLKNLLETEE
jgi:hypothetical protein